MAWSEICCPVFQLTLVVRLLWTCFSLMAHSNGWKIYFFIEEMPVFSPWPGRWLLNWEDPTLCKLKFFFFFWTFQNIPDFFWHLAFCSVWESPYVNIHRMELLQVLSVPEGTCSIKQAPGSSHHMIWSLPAVTCCFDASSSTRPPRTAQDPLPRSPSDPPGPQQADWMQLIMCAGNKSDCTLSDSVMKAR